MKVVRNSCPRVPEKRTGDRCSVKRSRDSGRDSGRGRFNGCCFEGYLQCLLVVTSDLYMSERRGGGWGRRGGGGEEEGKRRVRGEGEEGGGEGFRFRRGWRETEWRSGGGGWRTRCMTWHMAYLRHRMTRT